MNGMIVVHNERPLELEVWRYLSREINEAKESLR